jgi:type I restriction enzyme S subunit
MRTAHKLVPELRFLEFEEEWQFKRGNDLFLNSRIKGEDGLPIYSVTLNNGLVPRASLDKKMENDAASGDNLRAQAGDLVYNMMRMWQGALGLAHEEYMISPAYVVLSGKAKTDTKFFEYNLKRPRSIYDLWAYSYGLTNDRLRLYSKDFLRIKFCVPEEKVEQQKIASFLTSIDDKLTKLRRKRELLNDFKRGLMQQLFSQTIRFKQGDGSAFPEWETLKANLLFRNCSNKNHTGDLPILAVTQDKGVVRRDSIDIDIKASLEGILGYKVIEPGDFVISLRSFQGGIEYSKILGISSPAYTVLKPIKMISNGFYKSFLRKKIL